MAPRDSQSQRPAVPRDGGEGAGGITFRAVDRTSEPAAASETAPPEQQVGVSVLARILDLENTDVGPVPARPGARLADIFRGFNLAEGTFLPTRVFGGQLIGQGLVAASRTVDAGQPVHSLHCYFLRPGTPLAPFVYVVDRTRDGTSFSTRTVTAQQRGEAIFKMTCSFHAPEKGSFAHAVPMPVDVPTPDGLPTQGERLHKAGSNPRLPPHVRTALVQRADTPFPLDFRQVVGSSSVVSATGVAASRTLAWFRSPTRLPDDPALHRCVAAYGSDLALLETTLVPHRKPGHKGRLTRHMVRCYRAPWCSLPPCADPFPACAFSPIGVNRPQHVVPRAIPGRRVAADGNGVTRGVWRHWAGLGAAVGRGSGGSCRFRHAGGADPTRGSQAVRRVWRAMMIFRQLCVLVPPLVCAPSWRRHRVPPTAIARRPCHQALGTTGAAWRHRCYLAIRPSHIRRHTAAATEAHACCRMSRP